MNAIPYFDAHCDTLSRCLERDACLWENDGQLDLKRLGGFAGRGQVFAIYHDSAVPAEGGLFAMCRRQQALFADACKKHADRMTQCRNGRQIDAAVAAGRLAAVLSVEGGELLDCDPEKLDWAREAGVRCVNLTWNHANALSGSNVEERERGLSGAGREFVRQAQSRNILIDVSHLSDPGFWDLVDITEKPIVATHSNARALCGHTRNLTDDMFRAIVQTGGVVGINFWVRFVRDTAEPTMDDLNGHIDRFMELGGAGHLCLGGDLDGCDELAGGMTGVQDVPRLWRALADRGYTKQELEDLFFNNLRRVLE